MRHVLAYDVVSNRRRSRFQKRLKGLMVAVQKSVFEAILGAKELSEVERLIISELDLEVDEVRMYALCKSCGSMVRTWGPSVEPHDPKKVVVL